MKPTKIDVRFFSTSTKQAGATVSLTLPDTIDSVLKLPTIDGNKRTQDRREKILGLLEQKMEQLLATIEIE